MKNNPYQVLGVSENSSLSHIKAAYRVLVKKYHPDAGGNKEKILAINAAWEILKDKKSRNSSNQENNKFKNNLPNLKVPKTNGVDLDKAIGTWLKEVYFPIDSLLCDILNRYQKQLKDLSADPYDEMLMKSFCQYIENSQKKIKKVQEIYQSIPTPLQARRLSLSLYQCFAEIEDGINEWERYTVGYVENYLHDGKEMLREAKKQHLMLQKEKQYFVSL